MAWGDPAVTRLRRQADKSITYAVGVNNPTTLEHVGLLKRLRLINRMQLTISGSSATRDLWGPWNAIANLLIRVSGLDLLYQVSGWGAYLIDLVSSGYVYTPDFNPATVTNNVALGDLYNFPTASGELLFSLDLPFTTPLLGFEDLGLWLIQNETVNMEVVPTYNNMGGALALAQPYVLTGNGAVAVTSGSTAIWRDFYGVPGNQNDMPPLGYVHQWEEQYDAISGTQVDINHQRGGIILRVLHQIVDVDTSDSGVASVSNGLTSTDLASMEFKYGANETPYDEDVYEILQRQRETYGRDLPQGVFTYDFFSGTRTLQDTFNTENYINMKTRLKFAKTLITGCSVRTIRERLLPVVVNTQ